MNGAIKVLCKVLLFCMSVTRWLTPAYWVSLIEGLLSMEGRRNKGLENGHSLEITAFQCNQTYFKFLIIPSVSHCDRLKMATNSLILFLISK